MRLKNKWTYKKSSPYWIVYKNGKAEFKVMTKKKAMEYCLKMNT